MVKGMEETYMAKKKKKWILWVVLAVVAIAIAAGVLILTKKAAAARDAMITPDLTATVEQGTLETTITASGMLEATDTDLLTLPDGLKVADLLVQAGDEVKAGAPLARLDPDSVATQLFYVNNKLATLDKKLGKGDDEGSITAPAQGRLKYQPVTSGEDVIAAMKEYGCLAILSADGLMNMTIQTDLTLSPGDRYTVKFTGGRAWGSVVRAVEGGYFLTLPDDRAPYGETAEVYDGDTLIGSGKMDINMPIKVVGFNGVIDKIAYKLNEGVAAGKNMFSIKNARIETAYQKKYYERTQVSNRLSDLILLSSDPTVYAPFDCVVSEVLVTEGANTGKVEVCDRYSDAFKLGVEGATKLVLSVDELDINKVALGQTASITFTAYDDESFTGTVSRIGKVGKKQNSISTYSVEVTLPWDARLLAGMNATATILVDRAENVLLAPMDAIEEDADGQYVFVLDAQQQKQRVAVTTGLSDGTNVEITSGLKEGDVVSYPDPAGSDLLSYAGMAMTPAEDPAAQEPAAGEE
jgi:multidrug efflux pump subunit AcrA (membrane-fusion protein)